MLVCLLQHEHPISRNAEKSGLHRLKQYNLVIFRLFHQNLATKCVRYYLAVAQNVTQIFPRAAKISATVAGGYF